MRSHSEAVSVLLLFLQCLNAEAKRGELDDYLLLDLQGVHVVIALCSVFLRVGLGINQHVVLVPERWRKDN